MGSSNPDKIHHLYIGESFRLLKHDFTASGID